MRGLVICSLIIFCSCHLEVNTVDPQAAKTMSFSKKHHFYVDSCQIPPGSLNYHVKEAWIEKTWKNEVKGFNVSFKETGTKQLIIVFDSSFNLSRKDYFSTWEMRDSHYGSFGLRSGVYALSLGEDSIPYHYQIDVVELRPKERFLFTFHLERSMSINQ